MASEASCFSHIPLTFQVWHASCSPHFIFDLPSVSLFLSGADAGYDGKTTRYLVEGKGIFYVSLWDQVDPSDDFYLGNIEAMFFFLPRICPGILNSTPHQVQGEDPILAQEIEPSTFRL